MNMMSSCGMNMNCGCQGDKSIFKMVTIISVLVLVAVFGWEYYAAVKPCILCVYERYPYGAALLVSLYALWRTSHSKCMIKLLTLIFLVSLGLSVYHIGVEQQWFIVPEACVTSMTAVQSVYDVMQGVSTASNRLPCDQAAITFLGLSLTAYNAIVSLLILIGLVRWSRKRNMCVAECCSQNSCAANTENTPSEPRG